MNKKFKALKGLGLLVAGSGLALADAITIPQEKIDEITASATNVGGSAVTVWITISAVVLSIVILKKVFR